MNDGSSVSRRKHVILHPEFRFVRSQYVAYIVALFHETFPYRRISSRRYDIPTCPVEWGKRRGSHSIYRVTYAIRGSMSRIGGRVWNRCSNTILQDRCITNFKWRIRKKCIIRDKIYFLGETKRRILSFGRNTFLRHCLSMHIVHY